MRGYLYILINPSIPNLAKVGKTTRDPKDRVIELSRATGVPTPFILAYQQPVDDCNSAERWVHQELEERGARNASNREFFTAPLHEIVNLLAVVGANNSGSAGAVDRIQEDEEEAARSEILDDDEDKFLDVNTLYLRGLELLDAPDPKPYGAFIFLEQAAMHEHKLACEKVADMLFEGLGAKRDPKRAEYYYREASKTERLTHADQTARWAYVSARLEDLIMAMSCWRAFFQRLIEDDLPDADQLVTQFGWAFLLDMSQATELPRSHRVPSVHFRRFYPQLLLSINEAATHSNPTDLTRAKAYLDRMSGL
ncbi:GIY-YIG nuclease family protein [Alcaligenaceae bacterium B3P038]|nr:GIY-YIG nuclease family protein [Alcaligenaceae bacterium B3P038]